MDDALVTLITGGASGIGAATPRRPLGGGAPAAAPARGLRAGGPGAAATGGAPGRLERFARELGDPAGLLTRAGDTADHDAVRAAVDATVTAFGRLDAVVANAGYATHDGLGDGDPAGWRDMVLTNVLGPALLIHAALPALRESRGRIVLVGSVAGLIHTPGNLYGATKWAVTGLAENTRQLVTGD